MRTLCPRQWRGSHLRQQWVSTLLVRINWMWFSIKLKVNDVKSAGRLFPEQPLKPVTKFSLQVATVWRWWLVCTSDDLHVSHVTEHDRDVWSCDVVTVQLRLFMFILCWHNTATGYSICSQTVKGWISFFEMIWLHLRFRYKWKFLPFCFLLKVS